MDINFEIEKRLIEEYEHISRLIWKLEVSQKAQRESFSSQDEEKLEIAKSRKQQLKTELINLSDRPLTEKKVSAIVYQLNAIITALAENEFGFRVTKNQGLVFDSAIYYFIMRDIEWALNSTILAWHSPRYYHSNNSSFNTAELKNLLSELKQSLISNPPANYVELDEKVTASLKDIKVMAKKL